MLSINTNLSSLIAQNSMSQSTNNLNQAIERMTTGFKINHAKDNAANYSIATNMSTQMGSYNVAAENVAMGMDLVATASDTISLMQSKAERLHSLCIQARNGTYGQQSMNAINTEAGAIMAEINRIYSNAEYNGIALFKNKSSSIADHLPKAGDSGFIEDPTSTYAMRSTPISTPIAKAEYDGFIVNPKTYSDAEVAAMTALTDDVTTLTAGNKYSISNLEELINLAELVNSAVDTTGVEFVLGADIDLSSIDNWVPIGEFYTTSDTARIFKGIFDGNGHVIKNITIDTPTELNRGLFGRTSDGAEVKNVGIEGGNIKADYWVGGLIGVAFGTTITNCYTNCNVVGVTNWAGGLVGSVHNYSTVTNCYSKGNVEGKKNSGGLIGNISNYVTVSSSYSTSDVQGERYIGGLVGYVNNDSTVDNCYAIGNVTGKYGDVGGLAGHLSSSSSLISNSYATGNVSGTGTMGGLVGHSYGIITDCYATGDVKATSSSATYVGGLVGRTSKKIVNSYATGNVTGSEKVGGLVGESSASVVNCYATGNISGKVDVGGLAGYLVSGPEIVNCYSTGDVTGNERVGGLVGTTAAKVTNCYASGNIAGGECVGGLFGAYSASANTGNVVTNSYSNCSVNGEKYVGGVIGKADSYFDNIEIVDSASYSSVSGNEIVGSFVGGVIGSYISKETYEPGNEDVWEYHGELLLTNCSAVANEYDMVAGNYDFVNIYVDYTDPDTGEWILDGDSYEELDATFDMALYDANIAKIEIKNATTSLLVGINGDNSCKLTFDTNFSMEISGIGTDISSDSTLSAITNFINQLSEQETKLGAVQNRLESALESIEVNINNLTSSLSTIRDADIAEVSSEYIRQQILQQASATLMATANQSPAIALQLI